MPSGVVLAVDGGNSKTDVLLVDASGRLLAGVRGDTVSHQAVGIEAGMARLADLVAEAAAAAGLGRGTAGRSGGAAGSGTAGRSGGAAPGSGPATGRARRPVADVGVFCLAGADFPRDLRLLRGQVGRLGLVETSLVLNDTRAALRAGAREGHGVALVCGQGINAVGVAPDGRVARFAAVGTLSGDWGGATSLGEAGLGAAIRARDGRGPRTALERTVPAAFGLVRAESLMLAMYEGRIPERRLGELSAAVFATAEAGDEVARSIIDHLADELAVMAVALLRRLGMLRRPVQVVLAGGVFRTRDAAFYGRLRDGIRAAAPRAEMVRLDAPPVLGAALLGLDALAGSAGSRRDDDVSTHLRAEVARWDGR